MIHKLRVLWIGERIKVLAMRDGRPPFQPLSQREAGKPIDTALTKGVPLYLVTALRQWVDLALRRPATSTKYAGDLAEEVALRLRLDATQHTSINRPRGQSYVNAVLDAPTEALLNVVDAVLYCYPSSLIPPAGELDRILEFGGSAYRVDESHRQLVLRVDETVEDAVAASISTTTEQAADYLRRSWQHAYGLKPDWTAAYREAVRAVEEAFVPVVSPNNTQGTLGTVCRDLGNQESKWELVLVDTQDQPAGITHFVALLKQLWQGQRSRHGGGASSRDQSQAEAEAAVHLAALAVHWISTGALRRKT